MDDLEVQACDVEVGDDGHAVGADGDGGVLADVAGGVEGLGGLVAGAGDVGAVDGLEVVVGVVVVGDDGEAVGADGDGGVPADDIRAVEVLW